MGNPSMETNYILLAMAVLQVIIILTLSGYHEDHWVPREHFGPITSKAAKHPWCLSCCSRPVHGCQCGGPRGWP